MNSKSSSSLMVRRILRIAWMSLLLVSLGVARPSLALAGSFPLPRASADTTLRGVPWTGGMGITETTGQIMARQAEKDAGGIVEPVWVRQRANMDYLLPVSPAGSAVASSGSVLNEVPRAPDSNLPQTLGLNFKADQMSNSVPPDTMGTPGPTQFLSTSNDRLRTFSKTTGALDGM
jgi:hypothetical protein